MRIRTLVPALACLAAAPFAAAADSVPAVKIDGFVDTILSGASTIDSDGLDQTTENDSNTEFSYNAKLGLAATISDKVSALVELQMTGAATNAVDSNGDPASGNEILVRQAYGIWKVAGDVELKTGKFISDYGWVAAYAPGLYRINTGPIIDLYGGDQVGANVKMTKDALTAALTIANGLFGEGDNGAQSAVDQKDQAMFVGVDLNYALGDKGSVNAELGYDMDANPTGGDAIYADINATLTPNEQVLAGLELVYNSIGTPDNAGATEDDESRLGLLAMVNYKLGDALPMPSSATAMLQYVSVGNENNTKDNDTSEVEFALALLTNPAGTDKLGLNFEIYYSSSETDDGTATTEATELGLGAELLYVF